VIDINVRGVFATTQTALKHMKDGRSHHHGRFGRGRACRCARACALRGHEGSRQDVYPGTLQRVGSRGITVNNVQPGPIDTDLNPASGDWAGTTEGRNSARPLWARR